MIHDRFEDRVLPLSSHSRWRVSANSSIVRAFTKGGEKAGTCRGHVRDKTIEARYPISRMLGRVSTQPSGLLARDSRSSLLLKKPALFLARTTYTHTRARATSSVPVHKLLRPFLPTCTCIQLVFVLVPQAGFRFPFALIDLSSQF